MTDTSTINNWAYSETMVESDNAAWPQAAIAVDYSGVQSTGRLKFGERLQLSMTQSVME